MLDYLQTLNYAGFTARMKRLSDGQIYDSKKFYQNSAFDIEPNWHMVFLLLKDEGELTVTEIAKRLKFSHPAIIKIVGKMKDKEYLESIPDTSDCRKTLLRLSDKSIKLFPAFEKMWNTFQEVIREVIGEDFLEQLSMIENKLANQSLSERYFQKVENKSSK